MSYRAFIVDDHEPFRTVLGELLSSSGYTVCGSSVSAEEALAKVPKAKPDVMLVDVCLPEMNGLELISKVRQQLPSIKCVVVTAHPHHASMAQRVGACAYISKAAAHRLGEILEDVLASPDGFQTYEARLVTRSDPSESSGHDPA